MLIPALTAHFQRWFERAAHHTTVLWFDPNEEYAALLDHLNDQKALELWRYEDSLLELRYRLIHRAPDERTVVYLPLSQDEAEILRPFFATSLIFRDRLYKFLRKQGLDFPDDPETKHQLRSLLPRLAARSVGKGRSFWEYNLANLERARETLLGNFDDTLLQFLAGPRTALANLQREQLDGLFSAQLESAYGLVAAPDDDPEEIARRLTAQLVLVRAFTDAGQPDDFPYAAQLPEPLHFGRCEAFLDRWQRDSRYQAAYVRLADDLERRYDLARWVKDLSMTVGLTLGATFANVETALWEQNHAAMDHLSSEDDWQTWLAEHRAPFEIRADSFWAREGRAPWWDLLVRAADLLTAIQDSCNELDRQTTPKAMLRRYAEAWWTVDHDFRRLREAMGAQPASHNRLRDRCVRSYRDVLRRMNDRFTMLLETEGEWPPAEALPPQDHFWGQVMEERESNQRVAVIFIDALRYELAQELLRQLDREAAGDRRALTARLAAIPTVTPIGMTALLPGGDQRAVDHDGEWSIVIEDSRNLKDKSARQDWLERRLDDVQFYNLDDLLNTPADRIPEASVTVVFDTTLDAVGETASTIAWNTFGPLLQAVKKGIYKLLELGIDQIHVVTDHGFLLLDEVAEHEKVSLRDIPAQAKKSRYVVGHHLGHTDQLSFPVRLNLQPGSERLEAWFPRGVGCFRTPGPYNYVHGGLSLQELVVPHLTIEQQVTGRPVTVAGDFPDVIRNAQPDVRLYAVDPEMFEQPRQVTVTLEKGGEPVIPPSSQPVGPAEPVKVPIFLPMGCGLEPGNRVRWVLRDAVTEEVLDEQKAVSQVDLW